MQKSSPALELVDLLEAFIRWLSHGRSASGLSLSAAAVLFQLSREGPQRLTDLAARVGLSQPAMTQLVTRLEYAGMVRRAADTCDRRVVLVQITRDGRTLFDRRKRERVADLEGLLGDVSPDDRDAIVEALPALARLVSLAEQRRNGPAVAAVEEFGHVR